MYAKLYSKILHSSVWFEDAETRIVWITLLALADQQGYVFASPPGLAHAARVPLEATRRALEKFLAPDPDSSDLSSHPETEGRRIETVDGGWRLLNYEHYRALKDADEQREQARNRMRNKRARDREAVTLGYARSRSVTQSSPSEAEAEAEAEAEKGNGVAPPALLPTAGPVFKIVGRGKSWQAPVDFIDELRRLYPAVDVTHELEKAALKIKRGVVNAKTEGGMPKFLHSWMEREQNRARPSGNGAATPPPKEMRVTNLGDPRISYTK